MVGYAGKEADDAFERDRSELADTAGSDPICGHCEKPKSQHQHEFGEIYCFRETTGDLFTDEPNDSSLLGMLSEKAIDGLRRRWQRKNGHL